MKKKAVVLLSGGIDSSTVLALVVNKMKYSANVITFDYGQRNKFEIEAAKKLVKSFDVQNHIILKIDLNSIGGSALTSNMIDIPENRDIGKNIPATYVPARNMIFLSLAVAWAEVLNCQDIYYGANNIDYSGYPDCRPEFIEAFEKAVNLGTRAGVQKKTFKINSPLIDMTKAEIINLGFEFGVDYSLTFSCYNPDRKNRSCGKCDSCIIRKRAFSQTKIKDPTIYAEGK